MQGLVGEDEPAEVDPEALGLVKNLGFLHRATGNRGKVLRWGRAVIHLFADVPNMRHAVNRIDTVTFEFLRDHTWVAGRGVLRLTHTHKHAHARTEAPTELFGVSQNLAIYVILKKRIGSTRGCLLSIYYLSGWSRLWHMGSLVVACGI